MRTGIGSAVVVMSLAGAAAASAEAPARAPGHAGLMADVVDRLLPAGRQLSSTS